MRDRPTGAWRATVTRVSGSTVWVEVPRLARGYEFGPLEVYDLMGVGDPVPANDGHQHNPDPYVPGDRVLVMSVEGRPDDLVVLGRRR